MTAKIHTPAETEIAAQSNSDWYPMQDLDLTTMTDNITLQKHDRSINIMESKLNSVEENQIAAEEQITELKDQLAQMCLEYAETKRTVVTLRELVRTELLKKTVEADERSILIPGSKEVSSSIDPVHHQAPELLAKPHPQIPQSKTPVQSTPVNEGRAHAPMYMSAGTYTSPNVFSDQGPQISDESCQLQEEDNCICKAILNEYSMKVNVEKPIYNSGITDGQPSASVTSLTFNGKYYVGDKGRNKKESQNLAARAAILSLLDSDANMVISKIISKWRLSSLKDKVKLPLVEQGKVREAKNSVGIYPRVQIAAVPSSQTCTLTQSVPSNCDPLQGFDNAVLSGPCVLPKFGSGPETHILVCWRKPEKGFIALNADGASQNGIAAGGGILRDHTGKHISNFYNNYGTGSVFIAESKAILDGLSICKELGYNKIQLQTDSRQATLCFGRRSKSSLSEQSIWDEIYKFQDELSIEILHVCREGNKMADYLSKKGILAKEMGTIDVSLDERAKELLAGEKLGISYLKKLKNQSAGVSENNLHTGVQIAPVSSSELTTCTVAESVPSNCVSLQGLDSLDNDLLSGPCVLPELSGTEAYFLIYWKKPREGFIAFNTQVSHRNGVAAGSGVLRNHNGEHISNFYNNYGRVSINFAKSKAILDGLVVCKELGYDKILIQTDSALVTLWFHRQLTVTVPLDLQTMWNEIYKFQDALSVEILHVYKEGNKLADHLSRKGVLAEGMGSININLDERAKELLIGEKLGISCLGKLKNQCIA
ncbi:uncharacterized protein LOC108199588 isoform X1 [Daucus carota subsp. sativus]|nr:PREDICTED: uncharacterized protein LOC108199588 isoform X2 [Daucus carota subsp. sativus]